MKLRKRQYVELEQLPRHNWHKIDPKKVRITEDLKLEVLVLEVIQVLKE